MGGDPATGRGRGAKNASKKKKRTIDRRGMSAGSLTTVRDEQNRPKIERGAPPTWGEPASSGLMRKGYEEIKK